MNLTQLLFLTMQTEFVRRAFGMPDARQNRLNGELQKILVGPDYFNLGPMMQKHAAVRARLMEWSRRNHKLICRP